MTAIEESGIQDDRRHVALPLASAPAWIAASWRADADARALWAPVLFGAGVTWYFALNAEPPLWLGPLAAAFLAGGLLLTRSASDSGVWRVAAIAAFWLALGFSAITLRTALIAAPVLTDEHGPAFVDGRIVSVDRYGEKGGRVVIAPYEIERLQPGELPKTVRVSWRGDLGQMRAGDDISVRAVLRPPPEPAAPGAFDFARQAYFQQLGAVGYAVAPPEARAAEGRSLQAAIEAARERLAGRIMQTADGDPGAISAALVTGKREAISEEAEAALRDTGLAHLLAISGLHMGLVSGFIFLGLRSGLALVPSVALRHPIKKWAAGAALAGAAAYLALSGASWSTQRAFVMASLIFIAVLADRRALSLRNVAIAALIILVLTPEAVLHAGFQMSFAAVTALIAAYEWARDRRLFQANEDGTPKALRWLAKPLVYSAGVAATTIVAEAATGMFSLHHFQHFSDYGLLANAVAMPVMAFWIMPWAVIGALLLPLGLDGLAWSAMAGGVSVVLATAEWVAALPGAVTHVRAPPAYATGLMAFGGLWLCLWRARWRVLGWPAMLLGLVLVFAAAPRAEFHVSRDARNAAVSVRDEDGRLRYALLTDRRDRFTAETWLRRGGETPDAGAALLWEAARACDGMGCAGRSAGGLSIALVQNLSDVTADCSRADVVVASQKMSRPLRRACEDAGAALIIDRIDIWRDGAHAVYMERGAPVLKTVAEERGERPWAKRRGRD